MAEILKSQVISYLKCRAAAIRQGILTAVTAAKSGHPGGSLSAVELVTALYFQEMKVSPEDKHNPDRDRFVLSKGHAAPVLYAALAEKGYFPKEELLTLRKVGSKLQGHPSMKDIAGVDMTTGSLGQGLSAACGMALAGKCDNRSYRTYVLLGDGELEEGQVWEAAMFAAHYKLDNLVAIIDNNGLQIDGPIEQVLSPLPIPEKWAAFSWHVINIDGHDFAAISSALQAAKAIKGRPTAIIAKTIKGKGISKMENVVDWHGKAPTSEECEQFLIEL